MDRLLRYFVERHLLVNVVAVMLVVLGYLSAISLQREFIPSVDSPILWITANLPGASARDMETKVTIPIEEALEEVEGIREFTTVISDNTSFTTVELLEDYNHAQIDLLSRTFARRSTTSQIFPQTWKTSRFSSSSIRRDPR